jgi:hypothetical protein
VEQRSPCLCLARPGTKGVHTAPRIEFRAFACLSHMPSPFDLFCFFPLMGLDSSHVSPGLCVLAGLVAEQFLETTAAQLTYHGLCELTAAATEDELSVFFRNNHFSTMTKHKVTGLWRRGAGTVSFPRASFPGFSVSGRIKWAKPW